MFRSPSEEQMASFAEAGVEVRRVLTIAEDDPRWTKVALLIERFKLRDVVTTEHSDSDQDAAGVLTMLATDQHGYPEPAMDGSYLPATFDLAEHCRFCGIGRRQSAPFRLKKTPALGKSILQLNWIFDEYFVNPDTFKTVFRPSGVDCRPVVLNKTGAEIDSVVQLSIPQIIDLRTDGLAYKECSHCGRRKYSHTFLREGPCPAPTEIVASIFKSNQYFGDGARAFRLVLISGLLHRGIKAARLSGVRFIPCAE
jgi:hypothetical protein